MVTLLTASGGFIGVAGMWFIVFVSPVHVGVTNFATDATRQSVFVAES